MVSFQRNLFTNRMKVTLEDLPLDISFRVFSFLDVPSVCRLYIAFSSSSYSHDIAQFLRQCKVEVTAETVITGDTRRIDFDTLARLPPCDIVINVKNSYLRLTLWYLKQSSYRSVAMNIDYKHDYSRRRPQPNLLFLGTKLTELSFTDIWPSLIPASVTKLKVRLWSEISFKFDFRRFTNLTHFWIEDSPAIKRVKLPQSITNLHKTGGRPLDVSTLPNLKRFETGGDTNTTLPWSQLESAQVVEIPPNQRLDQMKEISVVSKNQSFRDIHCPRLECVEYGKMKKDLTEQGDEVDGDSIYAITELFTDAQFARLTSLKGHHLSIGNISIMSLLQQMKVLHITFNKTLTESHPLPPNLVELVIWSSKPVKNIPSQLKVFEYHNNKRHGPLQDVLVKSANLKRLRLEGVGQVTIDCDKLTDLCLGSDELLRSIYAPNLTSLEIGTFFVFPFEHGFPRLAHVKLGEAFGDVVIKQHLKSVEIAVLSGRDLSISAETVLLCDCEPLPTSNINAKVLVFTLRTLNGNLVENCQELTCGYIHHVPVMVEKLTIHDDLDAGELEALELHRCTKLRYLSLSLKSNGRFFVPPSVRQLKVSGSNYRRRLEIETQNRLEHAEVWDIDGTEFTQTPVSLYFSGSGAMNFVPEFVTSLNTSKKHRLE